MTRRNTALSDAEILDRLAESGAAGLLRTEVAGPIRGGTSPLSRLILHKIVEWVPDSNPARYRITTAPHRRLQIVNREAGVTS